MFFIRMNGRGAFMDALLAFSSLHVCLVNENTLVSNDNKLH